MPDGSSNYFCSVASYVFTGILFSSTHATAVGREYSHLFCKCCTSVVHWPFISKSPEKTIQNSRQTVTENGAGEVWHSYQALLVISKHTKVNALVLLCDIHKYKVYGWLYKSGLVGFNFLAHVVLSKKASPSSHWGKGYHDHDRRLSQDDQTEQAFQMTTVQLGQYGQCHILLHSNHFSLKRKDHYDPTPVKLTIT